MASAELQKPVGSLLRGCFAPEKRQRTAHERLSLMETRAGRQTSRDPRARRRAASWPCALEPNIPLRT